MKILISGATGLVGSALVRAFTSEGHSVGRFVRSAGSISPGDIRWDPSAPAMSPAALEAMEGADAVVHLSGASIAGGRWTPKRKALIRSSRIDSTRLLVSALAQLRRKPRVLLAASAVGYYGSRGDEILTESSQPGDSFLATLAREWEAEALRAESSGIRTALLRFGVVLSAKGGALTQMLTPFRLGIGGRLGNGKQWLSWIALEDVVGMVRAFVADDRCSGPYNLAAPDPLQNADFTRIVARALHRPAVFPAPAFALRLMLGEMADALLLASERAVPERALAAGYKFIFPNFEPAITSILQSER